MQLHVGTEGSAPGTEITLPLAMLLRHMMALGSSGSGKTVLCKIVVEEAVAAGVPVICVDPQGDLCSLALRGKDAPSARSEAFWQKADVVVFTPASRKGIPLCADPIDPGVQGLAQGEKLLCHSRAADMIVSLLGYDLDSDDGAGLRAVIDTALGELDTARRPAMRLEHVTDYLTGLGEAELERYGRYLDSRKIRTACQRLARLDVGARKFLFHDGLPIDIDMLLGRGPKGAALPGKTRVSVIYLNTLHSQEDKEFLVAALAERLYAWMLAHPSQEPQAIFYIDEVAPYLPPVRKPACKPGLELLFKQARKYGVCCLMATQNPGDVDYKSMAQFGTWALGRLTTRQDLKKVEPIVKSMAPVQADAVMAELPARRPGEFALLAPDRFDSVRTLVTRRLHSAHETLDEERIAALTQERWWQRWQDHLSEAGRAADEASEAPAPPAGPAVRAGKRAGKGKDTTTVKSDARVATARASDARVTDVRASDAHAADARSSDARSADMTRLVRALGNKGLSAREFAERAGLGEARARTVLKTLEQAGLVRSYQDSRVKRYFALHTGARPDLGLGKRVAVVRPVLDRARIEDIGESLLRTRFLGFLGEDEELGSIELVYRPVYQVEFEEHVERTLLGRLVGERPDQLVGTVYYHPSTLQILVYTEKRGIEFQDDPGDHASRVMDFDGVATFDDVSPAELPIDEDAWRGMCPPADVKKHFRSQFKATPGSVTRLFVPLWKLLLRQPESGNYRLILLDALVGKPVSWPVP